MRGAKRLRGKAEANSEIPRSARNKLRNLDKKGLPRLRAEALQRAGTPFGLAMTILENRISMDNSRKGWLNEIKAVVFDFDGTLAVLNIDFSEMREQVFELMKKYGVNEEKIEERYLLEIIDEVVQILNQKNAAAAETFYQEAHQILHEVELKAAEEGKLLPGVEAVLKSLRGKGLKVGIVTRNCEEAVRKVVPDIEALCDVFVSRDLIKKVKPHPEQLTSVMKALNVSGEQAVMVGDHTIDIQAGKRVGMKTIGVLTGRVKKEEFEKAGADWVLEGASEICGLIEQISLSTER